MMFESRCRDTPSGGFFVYGRRLEGVVPGPQDRKADRPPAAARGREDSQGCECIRRRLRPDNIGAAGWSSPVARQAHNLKVVGSNPTPATSATQKGPRSIERRAFLRLTGNSPPPQRHAAPSLLLSARSRRPTSGRACPGSGSALQTARLPRAWPAGGSRPGRSCRPSGCPFRDATRPCRVRCSRILR